jgi:hypothetical protein
MRPIKVGLRMQPAPANLLRTAVHSEERTIYIPIFIGDNFASAQAECIWTDGVTSLYVQAHQGEGGPVIDLHVVIDPPGPLAKEAGLAA